MAGRQICGRKADRKNVYDCVGSRLARLDDHSFCASYCHLHVLQGPARQDVDRQKVDALLFLPTALLFNGMHRGAAIPTVR
jgi:hypothetical protein